MDTFAFVPYNPKPLKNRIRKPSKIIAQQPNRSDKNSAIDSSSAAGDNNWCQKVAGDGVATMHDAQTCGDDLVGTPASIVEQDGFDKDTDDEFPSLTRLLSSKYKRESAEERPSAESTTGNGSNQALDDSILGARGSRVGTTHDESIILHSGDESEDDNNLDPKHTRCIVEGGKPGCDPINMEHTPTLFNRTIHERGDGINKTMSLQSGKRQRSNSPPVPSTSGHTGISPLPRNEEGKSGRKLIDHSHHDKSRVKNICSKRRKVTTPLGGKMASDCSNQESRLSPISEDAKGDEDDDSVEDGTLGSLPDGQFASTTRTTPESESFDHTDPQLCPQVIDADQEWEVRGILGKEDVNGVLYYLVDWHPTLLPEHSLGHAKELVDNFEARIRVQRGINNRRGEPVFKTRQKASVEAKARSDQQREKSRGRPRKQT